MNRIFAPTKVEKYRGAVQDVVARVVADIPKNEPVDLISALCDPIPSLMYCHWIDADPKHAPFVGKASHTVQQVHSRNPDHTASVVASFDELIAFVEERIAAKRENMDDSLLSELIRTEETGELSTLDMRNWVIVMAAANTDNSSHSIGTTLIELAKRKDIWARIGRDPEAVKPAVAEVMRYHPRSISTSREVMEDIELEGVFLPKGTPVFANFGASHWNARYYPDPQAFDIDRKDQPPHLNFGGGIFSCIGRFFVTMEIEETMAHLARMHPDLELIETEFSHSPMFTNVERLVAKLN